MIVQRYVKKLERKKDELLVTKYEPGQPLNDLQTVADHADHHAELAEVRFPSGPVLLVRYTRVPDNHPAHIDYETVEAGDYLAYSHSGDFLFDTTFSDLQYWYDPA